MAIDVTTWALFGQASYDVTDQLTLTLGGRYSEDQKDLFQRMTFDVDFETYTNSAGLITNCYTCLADGETGRTLSESWGSFTPRVGIDFKPNDDLLLYASYSKGFKSGGWSPRPTPTNPAELPFDPEKVDSYEIGAKAQLLDRRLTFNLAAFRSDYTDIQLTTLQPGFVLQVINGGKNRLYGLEAEIFASPVSGLDLNASVGYLSDEYRDIVDSDPNFTADDELPDAPTWTINIGGQYSFPLSDQVSFTLRADGAYRSKTWKELYNLNRNSLNQFGGPAPIVTPIQSGADGYLVTRNELAQDGYWLVNLRGSVALENPDVTLSAFVTNLFDKEYYSTVLPVTAFGYDEGYYGRPREWGISLRYDF